MTECAMLIFAENSRQRGEYADATTAYMAYLQLYGDGDLHPSIRQAVAETYGDWAIQLHNTGEYEAALDKYHHLVNEHPDTPAAQKAPEQMAEMYMDWAMALEKQGDYQAAIARYQTVLDAYPDVVAAKQAADSMVTAYMDWAADLRATGDYEAALAHYQVILDEPADTPAVGQAAVLAAETFREWMTHLIEAGHRREALHKCQVLLQQFPNTPAADQARATLSTLYVQATQLLTVETYCQAIPLLRDLAEVDFLMTTEADPALLKALHGCSAAKFQARQYAEAIDLLEEILSAYSPSDPLVQASRALWIDARVARLQASVKSTLSAPAMVGSTLPDTALVVISNDSPERVEILFSGPGSRSVAIEPCQACQTWGDTPRYCAQEGPEVIMSLPPGEYAVAVIAHHLKAPPLVGTWTLGGGSKYFLCLFALTPSW